MNIKKLLILLVTMFMFNISSAHAASAQNMCVYQGVSVSKSGINAMLEPIKLGTDIGTFIKKNTGTSFTMKISPQINTAGFLFDLDFVNNDISSILKNNPKIAGISNNLTAMDYTDSWRVENLNTSTPIKYPSSDTLNMVTFGECPKLVMLKVHYEAYDLAGAVVGGSTGAAAGAAATVTFCGAAPLVGMDPVTCSLVFGGTGMAAGGTAGAYVGYKEGEKAKKWVIDDMAFSNELGQINFFNFLPGIFDMIDNAHILAAQLKSSTFSINEKYNDFNADVCLSSSDVKYYDKKFDDILNFAKNSSYINLYKNNKFDYIATIISKKYAKGGDCYINNPGLQGSYASLAKKANSVLDVFNSPSNQREKYKNECQYILGDPSSKGSFAYYIDLTFRFIKFLVPGLLVVLSIVDYIKIIASDDADLISKTNKKTVIRLIFALLIFMLPYVISTVLNLLGVQGSCDFPNINGL